MRDREVVASIVAGDPDGLATAYDRYAPQLLAYCRSLLREPADAADAVQDTFVVAASRVRDLRHPDDLRPWLYTAARNSCLRKLKTDRAAAAIYPAAPGVAGAETDVGVRAELADLRALVRDAAAGLVTRDREILVLRLWQDMDPQEAATVLGVSRNYGTALFTRAREQLEACIGVLVVARATQQARATQKDCATQPDCARLAAIVEGWDGDLTVLLRKRLSRHIDHCAACTDRRRQELVPALLGLSAGAAIAGAAAADAVRQAAHMPAALKSQVLAAASQHITAVPLVASVGAGFASAGLASTASGGAGPAGAGPSGARIAVVDAASRPALTAVYADGSPVETNLADAHAADSSAADAHAADVPAASAHAGDAPGAGAHAAGPHAAGTEPTDAHASAAANATSAGAGAGGTAGGGDDGSFGKDGSPEPERSGRVTRAQLTAAGAGVAAAAVIATVVAFALSGGPQQAKLASGATGAAGIPGAAGSTTQAGATGAFPAIPTASTAPGLSLHVKPGTGSTASGLPTSGVLGGGAPQPTTGSAANPPSATSPAGSRNPGAGSAPSSAPPPTKAATPPAAGTLSLSTTTIPIAVGSSGKLTLTADGGPVTWSITVPTSLLGTVSLSQSSGTLKEGDSITVTVSIVGLASLDTTLEVNPGDKSVAVALGLGL
jgi:RNA polymerase sigma factor (sigma-70 family)